MKRKQIWVDEFINVNKKIDEFESKHGKPTLAHLYADKKQQGKQLDRLKRIRYCLDYRIIIMLKS